MQLKKVTMAAVMVFSSMSSAYAADAGGGLISFSGKIITAPCSVLAASANQSIELDEVSTVDLSANNNSGMSDAKLFQIQLKGCDASNGSVSATFSGAKSPYDNDSLAYGGGTYLMLTDASNNKVILNSPSTAEKFPSGDFTMDFYATVVGGGKGVTITPGSYQATANFVLNYS